MGLNQNHPEAMKLANLNILWWGEPRYKATENVPGNWTVVGKEMNYRKKFGWFTVDSKIVTQIHFSPTLPYCLDSLCTYWVYDCNMNVQTVKGELRHTENFKSLFGQKLIQSGQHWKSG